MRFINGEVYLSPPEAGAHLGVSYKTIQRWVEAGESKCWARVNGKREKVIRPIQITMKFTPTGYRLYKQSDIEKLRQEFEAANVCEGRAGVMEG